MNPLSFYDDAHNPVSLDGIKALRDAEAAANAAPSFIVLDAEGNETDRADVPLTDSQIEAALDAAELVECVESTTEVASDLASELAKAAPRGKGKE